MIDDRDGGGKNMDGTIFWYLSLVNDIYDAYFTFMDLERWVWSLRQLSQPTAERMRRYRR